MRRRAACTLALLAIASTGVRAASAQDAHAASAAMRARSAQEAQRSGGETPPIVHYGKWGAAALFATFTSLGLIEHDIAGDRFRALQSWCINTGPCVVGTDGRYLNPDAEARYQGVVRSDRAARAWFVSGQLALGGAAALFVVELLHEHGTRNIPYSGLMVEPGRLGTKVGVRISL